MSWIYLVFYQRHHQDFENANGNDANVLGDSNKKGRQKSATATVLLLSGLLVLILVLICIIRILQKRPWASMRSGKIWKFKDLSGNMNTMAHCPHWLCCPPSYQVDLREKQSQKCLKNEKLNHSKSGFIFYVIFFYNGGLINARCCILACSYSHYSAGHLCYRNFLNRP